MLAITAHCLLRTNGDGRDTEKLLWIENRRNRCCVKSIRYQGFLLICKSHKTLQSTTKQKQSVSWIQLNTAACFKALSTSDLSPPPLAGSVALSRVTQLNYTRGKLGNPPWATQQEPRRAALQSAASHLQSSIRPRRGSAVSAETSKVKRDGIRRDTDGRTRLVIRQSESHWARSVSYECFWSFLHVWACMTLELSQN